MLKAKRRGRPDTFWFQRLFGWDAAFHKAACVNIRHPGWSKRSRRSVPGRRMNSARLRRIKAATRGSAAFGSGTHYLGCGVLSH
jgi:hypothetical protein